MPPILFALSLLAAPLPKQLIELGWDQPNAARVRDNLAVMEAQPFDGVMIGLDGRTPDGQSVSLKRGFSADVWDEAWFAEDVAALRACAFERLRENFVMFGANPGDVDWFDDDGWRQIVDHWRLAARLAKQTGCRGLEFDPEPYTKPAAQFSYEAQPQRAAHSFGDYYIKARERGREVMQAVAAEYPDLVLLTLFMNSVNRTATGQPDPRAALAGSGYGLYPAFIDGWLDAAPPTVTFVDGCESAYLYNSAEQYLRAAVTIKGACQSLVSPENRAKYRAQVQVGFGIYLDAYWNPRDSELGQRYYIDGLGGERVDRLRANVAAALEVCDGYVWVYGEKFRWWPTPNSRVGEQGWDEALPGAARALALARDPIAWGQAQVAARQAAGTLTNLARNGAFDQTSAMSNAGAAADWQEGGAPAGWSTWQVADSHGTFTWDREAGAARAAQVANGCFIQSYDVRPGELYLVSARRRLTGDGQAWLRARWQTPEGAWIAELQDQLAYAASDDPAWQDLLTVVEVPDGVGKLVLLLGMGGQTAAGDEVWFDDVRVVRL